MIFQKAKAISIFLLISSFSFHSFAQKIKEKEKETILINPASKMEKFHTIDELNKLGKADLIKLYKERYKTVILLLPYSSLSTTPGATLESLGIPSSEENKKLLEEENKASKEFYEAVDKSLNNFIAYADKANIVWSVILYEDIIKKISLGKDY